MFYVSSNAQICLHFLSFLNKYLQETNFDIHKAQIFSYLLS